MLLSEVLTDLGMTSWIEAARIAGLTMVNGSTDSIGTYDIHIAFK